MGYNIRSSYSRDKSLGPTSIVEMLSVKVSW